MEKINDFQSLAWMAQDFKPNSKEIKRRRSSIVMAQGGTSRSLLQGSAVDQAISRSLPTAAVRARVQARHWDSFLRVLRFFLCQSLHRLLNTPQHPGLVQRRRRTKWTQFHLTPGNYRKKKALVNMARSVEFSTSLRTNTISGRISLQLCFAHLFL
jgi:hypothetical protein